MHNVVLVQENSATPDDRVKDHLLRLARELSTRQPARVVHRPDGSIEELLLEQEVDGACYTVLRTYASSQIVALSPREREIARLVENGLPNKAIGAVLDISTWTVATHLRRIFVKLGVTSRAAMVASIMDPGDHTGATGV